MQMNTKIRKRAKRMGKVKATIDKRRKLDDNTYPVKLYCNIAGKGSIVISTNIYVNDGCLMNNTIINTKNAEIYNAILTNKRFKMEEVLLKMKLDGSLQTSSINEIRDKIKEAVSDYDIKDKTPTFKDTANKFIATKEQKKTIQAVEYMLSSLQKFCNLNKLKFADITTKFLYDVELSLKQNNLSTNTISIIFRNIRAVFNYAINENIIPQDCYPFRKYKIKQEATRKRSLTIEQMRALIDLQPETPEKTKIRDIFLLMVYLIGINVKDLLNVEKITNDRIEYKRFKTGRLYSVKVEPEAMEIINKYKGTDFLLDIPFAENFTNRFDKTLKKLGKVEYGGYNKKIITPIEPKLSSYYARHTWATFASELEIPKETIAAALGHGGNSVTDIYIDFNQKKVDEANRKVINYILG